MSQFLTLLKLEFYTSGQRNKDASLFSRIRKWLLILIGLGAVVALIIYALNQILSVCLEANLSHEFIVYYVFIISIVQLLFGISITTKTLYFKTDFNMLKLPVSGKMIFLAKIAYLFLYELAFTTILALPVFILYGVRTMQGIGFYLMLVPNMIFLPCIPFLFALLFSVPAMYLAGYLKNKFIVMFILYIASLALGFTIYIYGLKFILQILDSSDITNIFSDGTIFSIKQFANNLVFAVLFKNSLLLYDFIPSMFVNIGLICVLLLVIFIFADKIYLKIILSNNEKGLKAFKNNYQIKSRSIAGALFFREFINIFRSPNYSFQYLTVVATTPLMVYFSSEIASSIGVAQIGAGVLPGIIVLVLIMFLSMGTSFAATSVTREGENFFHTKLIPVKYSKQILIKFLMYLIVSIPAIFISTFILAFANFIDYISALLIALSVSMIIVGNICSSISLDIKRPQFYFLEGGEVTATNRNINSSIGVGFIIAMIVGIACIAISFFVSVPSMYLVLYGFGIPYMAIEIFTLFFKLEKRYRSIEL